MGERNEQTDEGRARASGVDVTLIDEMLRMTVRQRLEQNDRMAALAVKLRAAFDAGKGKDEKDVRRRGR